MPAGPENIARQPRNDSAGVNPPPLCMNKTSVFYDINALIREKIHEWIQFLQNAKEKLLLLLFITYAALQSRLKKKH